MDIYILRDGKEIGPFSEEATQTMLKQGSILINDLAWQPGMPQWIPLHNVLYPPMPIAPNSTRPPPPPGALSRGADEQSVYVAADAASPQSAVVNEAPPALAEPATAKQKAFLSFMGIPFPAEITRERAALLVNDALENPGDPGKLARWNEERLRLHPELFRAEIQAKKENRASHFFDVVHMQGAEIFDGVTKAHCQVLVGFLDVRYPNWDANEQPATWDYFFPAIGEKFPQLVKKEWKGKLKYPGASKVAPELARRTLFPKPARKGLPVGAIVRGIITGLAILMLVYFAYNYWQTQSGARSARGAIAAAGTQAEQVAAAKTSSAANDSSDSSTAGLEKLLSQMPAVQPTTTENGAAENSANGTTSAPPLTGSPAAMPLASGDTGTAPLFDPNATTSATSPPPNGAPDAVASQPRTTLVITKPTEVGLKFGLVKLPAGTVVRFVAQEGNLLRIRYGTETVTVPIASTDFNDLPPAAPAVPGPVPPTPAPLAPAPTVAPGPATPPPAPPTTPPTSPTSLF
ncbi:MAG TPA: GYF domain-containing protein [Chthoniobacteraceae bacterium]|nr:GYF domain-containing protein [Chthoniobacteraceae bacterium]